MEKPPADAITDFPDYAPFLKARFERLKRERRHFSYAQCARKLGTTPSFLKNILSGRRRVGLTRISGIARVLELDGFETQHFTLQAILGLVKDARTREYLTGALKRLEFTARSLGEFPSEPLSNDSSLLSDWLYGALIELMAFPDFEDRDEWFAERLIDGPRLPPGRIRDAIHRLLEAGVIVKRRGRYELRRSTLSTPDALDPAAFRNYRGIVAKAWDVLGDAAAYRKNHFLQYIVALSEEGEREAFRAAERYRDEILRIARASPGDARLLAISNNVFNLIRPSV